MTQISMSLDSLFAQKYNFISVGSIQKCRDMLAYLIFITLSRFKLSFLYYIKQDTNTMIIKIIITDRDKVFLVSINKCYLAE